MIVGTAVFAGARAGGVGMLAVAVESVEAEPPVFVAVTRTLSVCPASAEAIA